MKAIKKQYILIIQCLLYLMFIQLSLHAQGSKSFQKRTQISTGNILNSNSVNGQNFDSLASSFNSPPDSTKPRIYWWWLFNRIDKEGITRDLEQFKAKGISGVNLICTGGYAGQPPYRPRLVLEWLDLECRQPAGLVEKPPRRRRIHHDRRSRPGHGPLSGRHADRR